MAVGKRRDERFHELGAVRKERGNQRNMLQRFLFKNCMKTLHSVLDVFFMHKLLIRTKSGLSEVRKP